MPLLEVVHLTKQFGGLTAVADLIFKVEEGAILGLIGPNGAGKSTVLNLISGVLKPSAGTVRLREAVISRRQPHEILGLGMARTFQHAVLFSGLSVLESVTTACAARAGRGFWSAAFGIGQSERHRRARHEAEEILDFAGLTEHGDRIARDLPFGLQRMLGIAMALAGRPKLLLLDEPAAGLNPEESQGLVRLIRRINESGVTIVLVEHDMQVVMGVCQQIVVISHGRKISEGTPKQVSTDPLVIEAYLGADLELA